MTARVVEPTPATSRHNPAQFQADPVGFLRSRARAGGDLAAFTLGRQAYVLVSHPDAIAAVLDAPGHQFAKRRGKQLLGEGLLTSEGDHHARQRLLVAPNFHGARVAGYGKVVVDEAQALAASFEAGQVIDLDHVMPALMLNVVGRVLFGPAIEAHAADVVSALEAILGLSSRITHPYAWLLNVLPLPSNLAALRAKGKLDAIVYGLIRVRRRRGPAGADLLDMLLEAKDEDGRLAMGDRQIRDEALTLLLAGNETTSTALTWTWYLLGTHPQVLEALEHELSEVLAGEAPAVRHLPQLVWTRQVVTEAMRLYPPAWALWRNALVDVEVPGGVIPHGAVAVLSPAVTHHDPRFYPDPSRFDPSRWTGQQRASRPRYAYFPFGGGSRSCIGEPFAWVALVLTVATLARQWRLVPLPGQDLTLEPLITLRPRHGLKVRLASRTEAHP